MTYINGEILKKSYISISVTYGQDNIRILLKNAKSEYVENNLTIHGKLEDFAVPTKYDRFTCRMLLRTEQYVKRGLIFTSIVLPIPVIDKYKLNMIQYRSYKEEVCVRADLRFHLSVQKHAPYTKEIEIEGIDVKLENIHEESINFEDNDMLKDIKKDGFSTYEEKEKFIIYKQDAEDERMNKYVLECKNICIHINKHTEEALRTETERMYNMDFEL